MVRGWESEWRRRWQLFSRPLLEKREKWRTPFTSLLSVGNPDYNLSAVDVGHPPGPNQKTHARDGRGIPPFANEGWGTRLFSCIERASKRLRLATAKGHTATSTDCGSVGW
jgi:hypothetical protein